MATKPTYNELEPKIRQLEKEFLEYVRKVKELDKKQKGDPHKINYESPLTTISFISFFDKKFKPIGAWSGYRIASLFLPGHFIPAPFLNEFKSLIGT